MTYDLPAFQRVRAAYRDLLAAHIADGDDGYAERLTAAHERDLEARLEWAQSVEVELTLRRELDRRHDETLFALLSIAIEVGEILQTIGPAVTVLGTRMAEQAANERARVDLEIELMSDAGG